MEETNPLPSQACEDLLATANTHQARLGPDGLFVFLKIHECICRRVAATGSPSVVHLNAAFVEECLNTYRKFVERRRLELPSPWIWPYYEYTQSPSSISTLLPLFAAAHIIGDLEVVIARTEFTNKAEYDELFSDIVECAESVGTKYGIQHPIVEIFRAFDERTNPSGPFPLGLRLALAMGSIPYFRRIAIRNMREYAWATGQRRRSLPGLFDR